MRDVLSRDIPRYDREWRDILWSALQAAGGDARVRRPARASQRPSAAAGAQPLWLHECRDPLPEPFTSGFYEAGVNKC